ncbi:hypothetical protein MCOR17_006362 [Pyricularia oryzae]|nr:hypothetical protein MCOR17_006362 [Pyricularia oryzae]
MVRVVAESRVSLRQLHGTGVLRLTLLFTDTRPLHRFVDVCSSTTTAERIWRSGSGRRRRRRRAAVVTPERRADRAGRRSPGPPVLIGGAPHVHGASLPRRGVPLWLLLLLPLLLLPYAGGRGGGGAGAGAPAGRVRSATILHGKITRFSPLSRMKVL